jgi:hypothetical protein
MSDIEKLTEEERAELLDSATLYDVGLKALRVIDAQAARIAELEAKEQKRHADRLAELEGGTVSRVEYDRLVKQRDELRAERQDARHCVFGLRHALGDVLYELKEMLAQPQASWDLDEVILNAEEAALLSGTWTLDPAPKKPG